MKELRNEMEKLFGRTQAIIVPFSDAPGETNLDEPRKLYAASSGDLFVGTIHREDGTIDFEFISRNKKTNRFDFGVVRNFGTSQARAMIVNKDACITCHKAEGPIFNVAGWNNTIGNDALTGHGLYSALLTRLAAKNQTYEPFRKRVMDIASHTPNLTLATGELHKASKEMLTVWEGIDLAEQIFKGRSFEAIVVQANEVTVLDAYVNAGKNEQERATRIHKILTKSLSYRDNWGDRDSLFEEFSKLRENRPALLQSGPDFSIRMPGFDFSEASFLKYNELKKKEKFKNTTIDNSPIHESSFVKDSRPVGGQGTGSSTLDLNSLYSGVIIENFDPIFQSQYHSHEVTPTEVNQKLLAQFKAISGKEEDFNQRSQSFVDATLENYKKSRSFLRLVESGILPTPRQVLANFSDFILNQESKVESRRNSTKDAEHDTSKKCLDCHASNVPGAEFHFEFSSIDSWKQALSAADSETVKHAKYWLPDALRNIKEGTMPPSPFNLKIGGSEKADLVKYLESEAARH
jgi:hypothetical protein